MKEHNGRENIQNSIVYIFKLLKFKYKISIKENVNWFQKCGTILGIKEFVHRFSLKKLNEELIIYINRNCK